ncbi:MAG: type II secretion system protein [Planctomycetota bacterium]|jgi:prepilin-type N-terminal cleavage/methylation domain-containing protein|nr:type II secretion system protein [Planctomycetota bacterium]
MPNRYHSINHPARGFTMVELLVVISIISVLGGILIPAVNMARDSARKLECMSNLRQVGMVMQVYADDNAGLAPLVYAAGYKQSSYWFHNASGVWLDAGMIYNDGLVENAAIFFCSLNSRTKHTFNSSANPWPPVGGGVKSRSGYAFRPVVSINNWGYLEAPLPQLGSYSKQVIAADICDKPGKVLDEGHGDGVSAVWGDGHTTGISYSSFKDALSAIPDSSQSSAHNDKVDAVWEAFDATLE